MPKSLILLPLLFAATPVLAQPAPQPLPERVADPRVADQLTDMVQALSQAVLNVRIGGVQAAVEGRESTPAERRLTVRDLARRDDPNFDRKIQQRIAEARPMVHRSIKAFNEALPAINEAIQRASVAIERVAANMPDPTYPKR